MEEVADLEGFEEEETSIVDEEEEEEAPPVKQPIKKPMQKQNIQASKKITELKKEARYSAFRTPADEGIHDNYNNRVLTRDLWVALAAILSELDGIKRSLG
jgi:hypothetical protein